MFALTTPITIPPLIRLQPLPLERGGPDAPPEFLITTSGIHLQVPLTTHCRITTLEVASETQLVWATARGLTLPTLARQPTMCMPRITSSITGRLMTAFRADVLCLASI